jgi:hypothetical protein
MTAILKEKVDEFLNKARDLHEPSIAEFDLIDLGNPWKEPVEQRWWDKYWAGLGKTYKQQGVYIIWNDEKTKCYVGKSSQLGNYMGARVWNHFGTRKRFQKDREEHGEEEALRRIYGVKFKGASKLTLIPFPENTCWFASALEEFLIRELPAEWNKVGKK